MNLYLNLNDCSVSYLTIQLFSQLRDLDVCLTFKGVLHPWALFLKTLCIFSKIKQLRTKYPMDLVRNVPGNSKSTVLLQ